MFLRITLFALMGVALAAFGGSAWFVLRGPAAESAPPTVAALAPSKVVVLAAARPVQAGALLKPEDVGPLAVLTSEVEPGARLDTPQARGEVLGAMIRRSLVAGEVLMPADIMRPGDHGFLAAVLSPGMRAVSVGVDAVSGAAGLIWPGDNVDLILTIDDSAMTPGHRISGETVLHSVRVIAIDQQMVRGPSAGGADFQGTRIVTLEVTPAQAERVQVAVRLGKLSLGVVPAEETKKVGAADTEPTAAVGGDTVTWGGDVAAALRQGDSGEAKTLRVYQGNQGGQEFHF